MAIGEFGGAPAAGPVSGPMLAAPFYWLYEMSQASLNPEDVNLVGSVVVGLIAVRLGIALARS